MEWQDGRHWLSEYGWNPVLGKLASKNLELGVHGNGGAASLILDHKQSRRYVSLATLAIGPVRKRKIVIALW